MTVQKLSFNEYYRMQRLQTEIADAQATIQRATEELIRRRQEAIESYVGNGALIGFSHDFEYVVFNEAEPGIASLEAA